MSQPEVREPVRTAAAIMKATSSGPDELSQGTQSIMVENESG
jgi:hypothetical protein